MTVELIMPINPDLPLDAESRQAVVTLALRKLGDATGCPEAIEQAYALGYRVAEMTYSPAHAFQRWLANHTLDDVDPDIADAADAAATEPQASNEGEPRS